MKTMLFRGAKRSTSAGLVTAQFEGRDYLVVPVVALVEGVLHAVNSDYPELVLAEEFSRVPTGWNGRPVMLDHPSDGTERISANSPRVLEQSQIGTIFNTHVSGKKLLMEAWIDLKRAEVVDGAAEILTALRSGEEVEVSVGAFVEREEASGNYGGRDYSAVWRDIVPDHLALLSLGTTGACSIKMGCGAPRAAAAGGDMVEDVKAEPEKKTWMQRFAEVFSNFKPAQSAADMSDSDLREKLYGVLRSTQPAFLGVDSVYPDQHAVIFATMPDNEVLTFRQNYKKKSSGDVVMTGEPEQVTRVMKYEPVNAAATGCEGCQKASEGCPSKMVAAKNGEQNMEKKDRITNVITRLTNKGVTVLSAADAPLLESWPDERIAALEAQADALEKVEPKKQEPAPAPEPVKAEAPVAAQELSEEDYLKTAPQSIRQLVASHKAAEDRRRTELLSVLEGQKAFTVEELKGKDIQELEKLAALVSTKIVDYSGAGAVPRAASAKDDGKVPPAPSIDEFLKKK